LCKAESDGIEPLNQGYSTWAKSPPSGRFYALGEDCVIFQIWGAISVSKGAISVD